MERFQPVPRIIWRNDKFPFLSKGLQLVWFHLMTTPAGTPLGLVYGSAESLASELRQTATWYRKRLREGEEAGLWRYDAKNHVVYLSDYWTQPQNSPGNPNILTSWLKYVDEAHHSPLLTECFTDLEKCCSVLGDGYLTALSEAAGKFTKAFRKFPEGSLEGLREGSPEGLQERSPEGFQEGSPTVRRIHEHEIETETET
jgi:hypothetical protein